MPPRVLSLLQRNQSLVEPRLVEIWSADRSSVKNLPYLIWWNIARFIGCHEDFIRQEQGLQLIMDNASDRTRSIEWMITRNLKHFIWSSKVGAGNTEEDLSSVSNEESAQMKRLRAIYNQQSEIVRKEFGFHRWLKIHSSFYDKEMRNVVKSKPSFETWLNNKMFYETMHTTICDMMSFFQNMIIYCYKSVCYEIGRAVTFMTGGRGDKY